MLRYLDSVVSVEGSKPEVISQDGTDDSEIDRVETSLE